ncbi:MAG: leucine-rich repeat protein [Acutalibacteraceae bacterium]|nr:leucine-rich repeat protein [Acutalibacteraceae bacterium]
MKKNKKGILTIVFSFMLVLLVCILPITAQAGNSGNFSYTSEEKYVADYMCGLIDPTGQTGTGSTFNFYSAQITHDFAFKNVAEELANSEYQVGASIYWNKIDSFFSADFKAAFGTRSYEEGIYEAILLDYISFQQDDTKMESEFFYQTQCLKWDSYGFIKDYVDVPFEDLEDAMNDPDFHSPLTDHLNAYYKEVASGFDFDVPELGVETLVNGGKTLYEAKKEYDKYMALCKGIHSRIECIRAMKVQAQQDGNTAFVNAANDVINKVQLIMNDSTRTTAMLSELSDKEVWTVFKNMVFAPLVDKVIGADASSAIISMGVKLLDWSIGSGSTAENNVKLLLLYITETYAMQAAQNCKTVYLSNKTESNAALLNSMYLYYIDFDQYASEFLRSYVKAAIYGGAIQKFLAMVSNNKNQLYEDYMNQIDADISFCNTVRNAASNLRELFPYLAGMQNGDDGGIADTLTTSADTLSLEPYDRRTINKNFTLTKDVTVYCDVTMRSGGTLNLNGYTLRIYGNLTQSGGTMDIGDGRLEVGGDYRIQSYNTTSQAYGNSSGILNMTNTNDYVFVGGNFVTQGGKESNCLTAGTMEIQGDFTQKSSNYSYNFDASGTHKVILSGEKPTITFDYSGYYSSFNSLEITSGKATLVKGTGIRNLLSDVTFDSDGNSVIKGYLDLNGHTLISDGNYSGYGIRLKGGTAKFSGNYETCESSFGTELSGGVLTIGGNLLQSGGTMNIGGGRLEVGGDYRIQSYDTTSQAYEYCNGKLNMTNDNDYVFVGGDFVAQGEENGSKLTAGTMEIQGNFTQKKSKYSNSENFNAYGTHKVILSGEKPTITFDNPGYSSFNSLEITSGKATLVKGTGIRNLLSDVTFDSDGNSVIKGYLDLNGHTLISDGNYSGIGILLKGGTAKFSGNYETCESSFGTELSGGVLTIGGNLLQSGGTMNIGGGRLEVGGDYRSCKGALSMTNANDYVFVGENFVIRGGYGYLSAGTMKIQGDFTQNGNFKNFNAYGTHKVILSGEKPTITFDDPGNSGFNSLELSSGKATLVKGTRITKLLSDVTFDSDGNSVIKGKLVLNGHTLISDGSYSGDGIFLKGGTAKFSGNYETIDKTELAGGTLTVEGDFTTEGTLSLKDGKLTVGNNFTQYGTTTLEGTTLAIGGNLLQSGGTMNIGGGRLEVEGNLLQSRGTMDIGGGRLEVGGDYRIQSYDTTSQAYGNSGGILKMTNANDYVFVGENFVTQGYYIYLTAGTMEIQGDFTQKPNSNSNFNASGTHKVILSGDATQTVTFENYPDSHFNNLELIRPKNVGYIFNPDPCWKGTLTQPDGEYELTEWTWNGYDSAIASFVNNNNKKKTLDAVITQLRNEPQCEIDGEIIYTATVNIDGKTYTDTKTETLPKTGHNYKLTRWNWNGYTEAEVTFTCENDKTHTKTIDATITSNKTKPTCEAVGKVEYTETAVFEGKTYTDTKTETLPKTGHSYKLTKWNWNSYTEAEVIFTCENDKTHTQIVEATITSNKTEPTCEADGKVEYTATAVFDGKTYTDTKTETLPKTEHSYKLTKWNWNSYTEAEVTLTCENDKTHTQIVEATITSNKTEPTCEADGKVEYTATAVFEEKTYTDTKTEILPKIVIETDTNSNNNVTTDSDKYTSTETVIDSNTDISIENGKDTDTDTGVTIDGNKDTTTETDTNISTDVSTDNGKGISTETDTNTSVDITMDSDTDIAVYADTNNDVTDTTAEIDTNIDDSDTTTEVDTNTDVTDTTAVIDTNIDDTDTTIKVDTNTDATDTTTEIDTNIDDSDTTTEVNTGIDDTDTTTEFVTSTDDSDTTTEVDTDMDDTNTNKDGMTESDTDLQIVVDNLVYVPNVDGTLSVVGEKSAESTITVVSDINGIKVTIIVEGAFNNNQVLVNVIISDGINIINSNAFANCNNLEKVEIPNSVTEIADDAFENCNNLVIYGTKNSFAQKYSATHGIKFVATDKNSDMDNPNIPDEITSSKVCDLNGDGKVTAADSMLIQRSTIGLVNLTELQKKLADANGDGKVTAADALMVLRYTINLPTKGNIGEELD